MRQVSYPQIPSPLPYPRPRLSEILVVCEAFGEVESIRIGPEEKGDVSLCLLVPICGAP